MRHSRRGCRWLQENTATFSSDGWIVEETGPLRARVRIEGWLGHSRLRWTLSLQRAEKRLTMQIEVGFNASLVCQ